MKILEQKDPKAWEGLECRCPACESLLRIEADDLYFHDSKSAGITYCAVCKNGIWVDVKLLPKYVIVYVKAKCKGSSYYER